VATGGNGTMNQLSGELFKMMTGVSIIEVPYRGTSAALADLIGGQVQIMFDNLPSSIEYIKSCVYHKLRFGRIGDAARRGANVTGCVRFSELAVSVAHPCPTIGAFSARCNSKYTLAKFGADAPCSI
jgi:hypothetical protein